MLIILSSFVITNFIAQRYMILFIKKKHPPYYVLGKWLLRFSNLVYILMQFIVIIASDEPTILWLLFVPLGILVTISDELLINDYEERYFIMLLLNQLLIKKGLIFYSNKNEIMQEIDNSLHTFIKVIEQNHDFLEEVPANVKSVIISDLKRDLNIGDKKNIIIKGKIKTDYYIDKVKNEKGYRFTLKAIEASELLLDCKTVECFGIMEKINSVIDIKKGDFVTIEGVLTHANNIYGLNILNIKYTRSWDDE